MLSLSLSLSVEFIFRVAWPTVPHSLGVSWASPQSGILVAHWFALVCPPPLRRGRCPGVGVGFGYILHVVGP